MQLVSVVPAPIIRAFASAGDPTLLAYAEKQTALFMEYEPAALRVPKYSFAEQFPVNNDSSYEIVGNCVQACNVDAQPLTAVRLITDAVDILNPLYDPRDDSPVMISLFFRLDCFIAVA